MREATVLVLALAATLAADGILVNARTVANKELLLKQRYILELLTRPHLSGSHAETSAFKPEEHLDLFTDPAAVQKLAAQSRGGELLPRGAPFSLLKQSHVEQAQLLTRALSSAVDQTTFERTAAAQRSIVNEGLFVYVLSVAVIHDEVEANVTLPPVYETSPQLFVSPQVLQAARTRTLQGKQTPFTVDNVSPQRVRREASKGEEQLEHFTEDVGLAEYHTRFHNEHLPWLTTGQQSAARAHPRSGEAFLCYVSHLLSRYQLQRLLLSLPPVEPLDYDELKTQRRSSRSARIARDIDIIDIDEMEKLELRILDAIEVRENVQSNTTVQAAGIQVGDPGSNQLGNQVLGQQSASGVSLYQGLLRLVAQSAPRQRRSPALGGSPLGRLETQLHDRAIYRLHKSIDKLFERYKAHLPSYSREELALPGVRVEAVEAERLQTSDGAVVFGLDAALQGADVRVRQRSLQHAPFRVRVTVDTDEAAKVRVRFFLGPRFDDRRRPLSLDQQRPYLVLIDCFAHHLPAGRSVIERSSLNTTAAVPDQSTTRELLKKLNDAIAGKEPIYVDTIQRQCGFPQRLLLPKGSREGVPLVLYVVLSPLGNAPIPPIPCTGSLFCQGDSKPCGFPFDRPIKDETVFCQPNFFRKQLSVFHAEDSVKA